MAHQNTSKTAALTELSNAISQLVDDYVKKTGNPLIALMYRPSVFTEEGDWKSKEAPVISKKIQKAIAVARERRLKLAEDYEWQQMRDTVAAGYILCA